MQSYQYLEVVIAEDGSNNETAELIGSMRLKVSFPIQHIWHEDNGFQKTIILNKATAVSKGPYLVYTDGDGMVRMDFLQVHSNKREAGDFLSGVCFKLSVNFI